MGRYSTHGFGVAYHFNDADFELIKSVANAIMDGTISAEIYWLSKENDITHILETAPGDKILTTDLVEILKVYHEDLGHEISDFILYFSLESYEPPFEEGNKIYKSNFTIATLYNKYEEIKSSLAEFGIKDTDLHVMRYSSEWC